MSTKAASASAIAVAAATASFNNKSTMNSSIKATQTKHNMAMSKVTKVTKRPEGNQASAGNGTKTHKRSRSGCFTCRLRRKKCDEAKGACKACRHLGLACEYKRPSWWNDNNLRKAQKELIKTLIKKTKTTEKQLSKEAAAVAAASNTVHPLGAHTPPGLSRSVPTSATSPGSITGRTRGVSEDSQYSDYDLQFYNEAHDPYHAQIMSQYAYSHEPSQAHYYGYPTYPSTPYEVDIKTERQMYINDVPTRRDSTISSFSTYNPPHTALPPLLEHEWMPEPEDIYEEAGEVFSSEYPAAQDYVEFQQPESTTETTINIDLDECDRHLLEHFFSHVLPLIYPVMDTAENGSATSRIIIPALQSNKTYLSSCLSIAAIHLRSMTQEPSEQLDADIVRHRYATISQLCEALNHDQEHDKILEATLAMITLPCTVGRPEDTLPDIPWHKHFEAAHSLIQRLQLPSLLLDSTQPAPFNMSVAAWIDILGATMLGQAPKFANIYREKHLAGSMSGLAELMGCDDRIMYLISELSCLGGLENISEEQLCSHITTLGQQIELHESCLSNMYDSDAISPETGAVRPQILQRNITLLFSKAARIYLCSMIPGITRHDPTMRNLLNEFTTLMDLIPSGPLGFDRSIVWPLLIAGAHSTRDSLFRAVLAERVSFLGDLAHGGSFGRVVKLLHEVWATNDGVDSAVEAREASATAAGESKQQQQAQTMVPQDVHWRDIMQTKGWDFLLI